MQSTQLELFKNELDKRNVFTTKIPYLIEDLAKAINNPKLSYRMKLTIAVSEFMLFFSQFQKKIIIKDEERIPINAISFIIAPSGSGKDSSKSAVRSCFNSGYAIINEERQKAAIQRAIKNAKKDEQNNPENPSTYKKYYEYPRPLFAATDSTTEGLITDFNQLEEEGIGAGAVFTSEVADSMARGLSDIFQLVSETYDKGSREVKAIKDRSTSAKPLNNLPVNALFMGSQIGIIAEASVKDIFKKAFTSKLARRSYFCFSPEEEKLPNFNGDITNFIKWQKQNEQDANTAKQKITTIIETITEELLNTRKIELLVDNEVNDLFNIYKIYNEETAKQIPYEYQISRLVREHLQWKALKLAGAIAMSKLHETITEEDYKEAIIFGELLVDDIKIFEDELAKQNHEIFADVMNRKIVNNNARMSVHDIKKAGYIGKNNINADLKNLVTAASSYDEKGIYIIGKDNQFVELQKLDTEALINISYQPINNKPVYAALEKGKDPGDAKAKIALNAYYNYENIEVTFEEVAEMLTLDVAYVPFKLKTAEEGAIYNKEKHKDKVKGGIRGNENVIGGCKILVLDIDKAVIDIYDAHTILSDINHHITTTSDVNNKFKYRVIIELDAVVDIPDKQWKYFVDAAAKELGLIVDVLPKGQFYASYSKNKILSVTNKEPLKVKELLIEAADINKKREYKNKVSTAEAKTQLNNPYTTFEYAYEATKGSRSINLIKAAFHAIDLGATYEEVVDLVTEINSFWTEPLNEEEFQRTIVTQIAKKFEAI